MTSCEKTQLGTRKDCCFPIFWEINGLTALVASWQRTVELGLHFRRRSLMFRHVYTLNDYKPGVGGGPDGQILNQCFLRVRFFLPLIVFLFDARSFYGSKNLSLSKTLPKSASGWGRVLRFQFQDPRFTGGPYMRGTSLKVMVPLCSLTMFFPPCCFPCFRVIQKKKKQKKLKKNQKIYTGRPTK